MEDLLGNPNLSNSDPELCPVRPAAVLPMSLLR
jgi:hypothetical protein